MIIVRRTVCVTTLCSFRGGISTSRHCWKKRNLEEKGIKKVPCWPLGHCKMMTLGLSTLYQTQRYYIIANHISVRLCMRDLFLRCCMCVYVCTYVYLGMYACVCHTRECLVTQECQSMHMNVIESHAFVELEIMVQVSAKSTALESTGDDNWKKNTCVFTHMIQS